MVELTMKETTGDIRIRKGRIVVSLSKHINWPKWHSETINHPNLKNMVCGQADLHYCKRNHQKDSKFYQSANVRNLRSDDPLLHRYRSSDQNRSTSKYLCYHFSVLGIQSTWPTNDIIHSPVLTHFCQCYHIF